MKLPLVHFFETRRGRIDAKHFILVRVDGDGVTGYGERVTEQAPYYSSKTNETAWHIIADFMAPRVLGAAFAHPRDLFPALNAIRGSGVGRAANVHLSPPPNVSLPDDIAACKRDFDPDPIEPPIEVAADGTVAVPTAPGIGVRIGQDRVDAATLRRHIVRADLGRPRAEQAPPLREGV